MLGHCNRADVDGYVAALNAWIDTDASTRYAPRQRGMAGSTPARTAVLDGKRCWDLYKAKDLSSSDYHLVVRFRDGMHTPFESPNSPYIACFIPLLTI